MTKSNPNVAQVRRADVRNPNVAINQNAKVQEIVTGDTEEFQND